MKIRWPFLLRKTYDTDMEYARGVIESLKRANAMLQAVVLKLRSGVESPADIALRKIMQHRSEHLQNGVNVADVPPFEISEHDIRLVLAALPGTAKLAELPRAELELVFGGYRFAGVALCLADEVDEGTLQ